MTAAPPRARLLAELAGTDAAEVEAVPLVVELAALDVDVLGLRVV